MKLNEPRMIDDRMGGTISREAIDELLSKHYMHGDVPKGPFLVEGKGCVITDIDGKTYIDCQSQAWALNAGHGNEAIMKAAFEQGTLLAHCRPIHDTFPRTRLIEKLVEIAPGDLKKVGFALGGSSASESALKLAMVNKPEAMNFITLYNAWHGNSLATIDASWTPTLTKHRHYGFGMKFRPFLGNFLRVPNPYCYRCYFGESYPNCKLTCAKVLELTIEKAATGPVAAVYLEPLQGVGGQVPCPVEYLREVRRICDKFGVLLMYDEVQTAFGRMGTMFAADYYGVMPDVIAMAKGMGNGWPIGGILASTKLKSFDSDGEDAYTCMNNAMIHAAALANIRYIQENKLCENAKAMGDFISSALRQLQKKYPQIGDVRGPGLHIGVEFVVDPETKEPADDLTLAVYNKAMEKGVFFGLSGAIGNVLKIKPPLNITKPLAERVLEVFESCVKEATS
jgi:4-aminobutyrate aminotransferase-like enzyme